MRLKNRKISLKNRLFKFTFHPHGDFDAPHLLKSHYEKWVQKSPEALRHLGFLGWHPLRMHNMVAEVGFEPHDLRVMSPTSYQAALLRDMDFSFAYDIIPYVFSLVNPFFAFLFLFCRFFAFLREGEDCTVIVCAPGDGLCTEGRPFLKKQAATLPQSGTGTACWCR